MDLNLHGKVALVTGSSRGIGRAIAVALLAEGCRVVLNGRDEATLGQAARELGGEVAVHAADVTEPASCAPLAAAAVDRFATLDILVCNAGSGASVSPG